MQNQPNREEDALWLWDRFAEITGHYRFENGEVHKK